MLTLHVVLLQKSFTFVLDRNALCLETIRLSSKLFTF